MHIHMHLELEVLRAIVRLSRRRSPVTLAALTVRSGGTTGDIHRAISFLVREELVTRSEERGIRPTLSGLAIAVASSDAARAKRKSAAPAPKVDRARRAA